MPKSVGISEGGSPKGLSGVKRLLIPEQSGLYSAWVPRDDRPTKPVYITSNGTHLASDELMHGFTPITVNVPGGMDGVDASGAVMPAPVGGIGCSVIGVDPVTGLVRQVKVMPDGTIGDVWQEPKKITPNDESSYLVKFKGFYTHTGAVAPTYDYAKGKRDRWGNVYTDGVYRNGASSVMTLGYTIICQGTKPWRNRTIRSVMVNPMDTLTYGGFYGALDDDTGQAGTNYQGQYGNVQGGYRFDPIVQSTDDEIVQANGAFEVMDIRVDITVSQPILRNPVFGSLSGQGKENYGLMNVVIDRGYMPSLLGTHFGSMKKSTGRGGINLLDAGQGDGCTLWVEFDWYPNTTYPTIFKSAVPWLEMKVSDVMANATFIIFDTPENAGYQATYGLLYPSGSTANEYLIKARQMPRTVEYCGPISDAPESAFILD